MESNPKSKKLALESYGILRIILGIGQMVGLSAGYFMTEWVVRYPPNTVAYIIDKEIISLAYLTVLLRGVFHLVSGIGIARLRTWVSQWLIYGWPLMVIITWGFVRSLSHFWIEEGHTNQFGQIIDWPKVIIYLGFAIFDLAFVRLVISDLNKNPSAIDELGGEIELKKVFSIIFIVLVAFILLIFVGRPIKQGFHKGFYKSSGEIASSGQKTRAVKQEPLSREEKANRALQSKAKKQEGPQTLTIAQKTEVIKIKKDINKESIRKIASKKPTEGERGMPYQKTIGYVAALSIICGLLIQWMNIGKSQEVICISPLAFALFSFAFLLWIVYGLSLNLAPITLMGVMGLALSIGIIITNSKLER